MAFYNACSFQDKVETCRSLALHTTDAKTLRVLQSLIDEYSAKAVEQASAAASSKGLADFR